MFENREHKIDTTALRAEFEGFSGRLIQPGDEEYDTARMVWNGMIDRSPLVIAQCANSHDVQIALQFATKYDLPIAVRGGGHNVAGLATCDDGIVIDLVLMNTVSVDAVKGLIHVGGGAKLGDLDRAAAAHSLVVPSGVVSDTGVAGLTLSGGAGWLRRQYGLSCDNLIAAEVVLPGGEVIETDSNHYSDLLWALRGGGGNFGIVTRFTYQAYEMDPEVGFAAIFYSAEEGKQAMKWLRDNMDEIDRSLSPLGFFGYIPSGDPFPEEIQGKPMLALLIVNPEPGEAGLKALQPFRELGTPMFEIVDPMPWVEVQQFFDEDYPKYDLRYYWKSRFSSNLTDEAIEILYEAGLEMPSQISTVDIWPLGGAISDVDGSFSSFTHRSSKYVINFEANWASAVDDEANLEWVRNTLKRLEPFLDPGTYLNFPGFLEEEEQTRDTFGEVYERLSEIKAKYDPENRLSSNNNIKPAAVESR